MGMLPGGQTSFPPRARQYSLPRLPLSATTALRLMSSMKRSWLLPTSMKAPITPSAVPTEAIVRFRRAMCDNRQIRRKSKNQKNQTAKQNQWVRKLKIKGKRENQTDRGALRITGLAVTLEGVEKIK
jgi:hypothetical protein